MKRVPYKLLALFLTLCLIFTISAGLLDTELLEVDSVDICELEDCDGHIPPEICLDCNVEPCVRGYDEQRLLVQGVLRKNASL